MSIGKIHDLFADISEGDVFIYLACWISALFIYIKRSVRGILS